MLKKIVVWVWGVALGLIGGLVVHAVNVDFEFDELLPSWYFIIEFGIPLIAAFFASLYSMIVVECEDSFWWILWAHIRSLLIIAAVCVGVWLLSFCWSLIAYAIVSGELIGAILTIAVIAGVFGSGSFIVIRFFVG